MSEDWKTVWQQFEGALRARQERLLGEISSAWADVAVLHRSLCEAFVGQPLGPWESKSIQEVITLNQGAGHALLEAPIGAYLHGMEN